MTVEFVIIIFLANYFRKSLRDADSYDKWNKILTGIMVLSVGMLGYVVIGSNDNTAIRWVAHIIMFYMVYLAFWEAAFRSLRTFLYAVLPFVVIAFLKDLVKLLSTDLYNQWEDYFKNGNVFAVVWMFAMAIIMNKQKKALEKEKQKTQEKEVENKITVALKSELEVQVAERTAELTLQKEELEHTLEELRAMQAQLIQSEKMASLGELTAGIAHEIQNPLNFVNNFSEVNTELIIELTEEIEKGNMEEVKAIAKDIHDNEQKINFHGKRADGIVKGMLQHSRTNSGKKEPSDINALADEYLRLSYHGLRAKNKSFNAEFVTDFDAGMEKINVVSQDIGRVLLNLFNNAFYSVTEKKRLLNGTYAPKVSVTTKKTVSLSGNHSVFIMVKDNGLGVPQAVVDKIFQPFFTTKPSGQGTGLGLSLSYDIIKAHDGELSVETKEGEGAEFIIRLPC